MKRSKRRLLRLLAAALSVVLLAAAVPMETRAATSSEIQEELDALEEEREALQSKMDELEGQSSENWDSIEEIIAQKDNIDQQVATLYTEAENLNAQIRSYSLLIAANQTELDEAQQFLEELNEKNKERIRAMEEEGEISYWSVLFKADSFTDLIDRVNMIQEIQEADQRRLEALSAAAEAVSESRTQLENEKAGLKAARAELEEAQAVLEEKRAQADEILAELNSHQRELDELQAQYDAEEAELVSQIAAAEAEYTKAKQAEEEEKRKREEAANLAAGNTTTSAPSSSGWLQPCGYVALTSPYGYRIHPTTGVYSFHHGVDLANSSGTPIYASRSGTVTTATYGSSYGYYVTINHGDGFSSLYAHMTHYVVSAGQYVTAGQVIGYMGSTGRSTGPHLHFSIYYNGSSVNPMNYI